MSSHWQAELYSENSEFQYTVGKALIQSHDFLSTDMILDIGCGHGRLTHELVQLPNDFLKDKFLDQVVSLYVEYMPLSVDGSCQMTYTTATIIAHGVR